MPARTSSQSGNWNDTTTWGGASVPGDGDTATISAGHTVTVTADATVGTSGVNGTIAITLIGNLTVNAVLTVRGDISQRRSSTVTVSRVGANTGGITFDPASTRTYKWVTPNTGSGTPAIVLTGEAGDRVPIMTSLARGGSRAYFDFTAYPPNLDWDYVSITEWGGTGDTVATRALSYTGVAGSSIVWDYVRWSSNVGRIVFTLSSLNDFTLDWNNCDFRSPRNVDWLRIFTDTAALSGIRRIRNCTAHHSAMTFWELWADGFTYDGNILSNVKVDMGNPSPAAASTLTASAVLNDTTSTSACIELATIGNVVEESVFLANRDNPHYIAQAGTGTGTVRQNVVDGFGFVGTDAGDFVLPESTVAVERNLLLNRAGALVSVLNTSCRVTMRRNTLHGTGTFINASENGLGGADNLVRLSSNLFVSQPTGLIHDTVTPQNTFNCDYNGFYNQTEATNLDHPVLAQNSYLENGTWWATGAYGDDNKGQHDLYGDPQFADATRTSVTWYNSIAGSDGSFANVRAELLKLNGTAADGTDATFNSSYTVAALRTYLRDGFTPQASIYDGTGDPDDGSPDIGAMDFTAGGGSTAVPVFHRPARFMRRRF